MNMLLSASGKGASWLEPMRAKAKKKTSSLTFIIHLTRKLLLSVASRSQVMSEEELGIEFPPRSGGDKTDKTTDR